MSDTSTLIGKPFPVLDKGWIELQAVLGDDTAIVNAARTSYASESRGAERDKKLMTYLYTHGHLSPFEQAQIKIRVKMPIMVARQWLRYRMWKFNEQSRRYMEADEDDFYLPSAWRLQSETNKQGSAEAVLDDSARQPIDDAYQRIIAESYRAYQMALQTGIAREQARLFLPAFALYTTVVATVDIRNLMHFFTERLDAHAQWEIRQYATVLYRDIFTPLFPWTAELFVQEKS